MRACLTTTTSEATSRPAPRIRKNPTPNSERPETAPRPAKRGYLHAHTPPGPSTALFGHAGKTHHRDRCDDVVADAGTRAASDCAASGGSSATLRFHPPGVVRCQTRLTQVRGASSSTVRPAGSSPLHLAPSTHMLRSRPRGWYPPRPPHLSRPATLPYHLTPGLACCKASRTGAPA